MKRYSSVGDNGAVHFIPDARNRIYVAVTKARTGTLPAPPLHRLCSLGDIQEGYPSRVAHMLLEELQDNFLLGSEGQARSCVRLWLPCPNQHRG
jgi:hypothetical protein